MVGGSCEARSEVVRRRASSFHVLVERSIALNPFRLRFRISLFVCVWTRVS